MATGFFQIKKKISKSKLLNDSFWSLFGNVVFKGLSLLVSVIIARFLGKEIFGEFGIIKNTIVSIAIFSSFGLGYTATKFIAEFKENDLPKLNFLVRIFHRITLFVSGVISILVFSFSGFIAKVILEAPHLEISIKILSILIIFNALIALQIGVLSGLGKFKDMAKVNFAVGILLFTISVVLTYYFALNGALLALLVSQIFNWYFNFRIIVKSIPRNKGLIPKINQNLLRREIIRFSTPVALQEALYSIMYWLGSFMIIKYSTYGELGLFSASMQWNSIILFVPSILRNVILSHLSEASNNSDKHNRVMKTTISINFILTIIPVCLIYLFSNFIEKFYGNTFEGLGNLIVISVLSTVFVSVSNVYAQAYMSKGKNWIMFYFRMIRDLGTVLVFLLLLKYYFNGAEAMLFSSLCLSFTFMVIMIFYYHRKLK